MSAISTRNSPPAAAPSKRARRASTARRAAVVFVVLAAIITTAAYELGAFKSPPRLPPVGVVWFGTGLDANAHVLSTTFSTTRAGQPLSLVGHLRRPSGSLLWIQVSIEGSAFTREALNLPSGSEYAAWVPDPRIFGAPGPYGVVFVDVDGTELARGDLTVTP